MAIVYRHRRLDNNTIFYVGVELDSDNKKHLGKRAFIKQGKSKIWKDITNKTHYEVEIIANNLNNDDALELEIFLVKLYGRINLKTGTLANLTDGGEGIVGFKHSSETKLKMSNSAKGKIISESQRLKFSLSRKGISNINCCKKVIDIETKEIFNSVIDLSKIKNINKFTLTNKLNGHRFNNTNYTYLDNYYEGFRQPVKNIKINIRARKVINIETGEIFESIAYLSSVINIKRTTIMRSLKNLNIKKPNIYQYYNT